MREVRTVPVSPVVDDVEAPTDAAAHSRRSWKPEWLTICIAVLGLAGMGAGLYPMTAGWITSYNQSQVIVSAAADLEHVVPNADTQLAQARAYNDALSAGVVLGANAHVPVGDGSTSNEALVYDEILRANAIGLMARVKVPSVEIDLPVYHGTSDSVLNRGAGHLEGSHLPIGGVGSRSVLTAHRGLANATMFTNLDGVGVGDAIVVETFGKVLSYRVRDIQVIEPDDSGVLRAEPGEDLLTLITCTPLGINTHRIVVTATRVTPTPDADVKAAGAVPTVPGFPWWAVLGGSGALLVTTYFIRQGFKDAENAQRLRRRAQADLRPLSSGDVGEETR